VIGLLPMGGRGTRLGYPIPKPLMPTITDNGLVPLYRHALRRLHEVTPDILAMLHVESCSCLHDAVADIPSFETAEPNLPGALGDAGRLIERVYGRDTLVALAFPDSVWRTGGTLRDVVGKVRGDGALALFDAGADELDEVILDGDRVVSVMTKTANAVGSVRGWGAFIIRAGALATFTDAEKDGPQLGRLDMGWAFLGEYVDLGTPERYVGSHDLREK